MALGGTPWAHRLLYTSENGGKGGVLQGTPDYPSITDDLSGVFGRAGHEGIQADAQGNLILVEDTGGLSAPPILVRSSPTVLSIASSRRTRLTCNAAVVCKYCR